MCVTVKLPAYKWFISQEGPEQISFALSTASWASAEPDLSVDQHGVRTLLSRVWASSLTPYPSEFLTLSIIVFYLEGLIRSLEFFLFVGLTSDFNILSISPAVGLAPLEAAFPFAGIGRPLSPGKG